MSIALIEMTGGTLVTQTQAHDKEHRAILQGLAHRAMIERGLLPDYSAAALAEMGRIQAPATNERRAGR